MEGSWGTGFCWASSHISSPAGSTLTWMVKRGETALHVRKAALCVLPTCLGSVIGLRPPTRHYVHDKIRIHDVVGLEMHSIIMRSTHPRVHHERARLDVGALARLQDHRTDGQCRRSAPLQDFNIRLLAETQDSIADIGNLDPERLIITKLHVALIDFGRIHDDVRCSTRTRAAPTCPAGLVGE